MRQVLNSFALIENKAFCVFLEKSKSTFMHSKIKMSLSLFVIVVVREIFFYFIYIVKRLDFLCT